MINSSISVVVPVYNAAQTICVALDSICRQTLTPTEIIIVDDLSADNTCEIIQNYIDNNQQRQIDIKLIRQAQNGGPATARNTGIKASKNEWIAFLDGDDQWLPNKLETQINIATTHPEASLICSPTMPLEDKIITESTLTAKCSGEIKQKCSGEVVPRETATGGRPIRRAEHGVPVGHESEIQSRDYTSADQKSVTNDQQPMTSDQRLGPLLPCNLLTLKDFIYSNPVATSTVLVKHEILNKLGGFDEQFRGPEDYDLWLRIVSEQKIVKSETSLSLYRHVPGSLSMDDRTFLPQVISVLNKAFASGGVLNKYTHLQKRSYAEKYSSASWMAFNRGSRTTALRHLAKSYLTYARCILPEEKDPLLRLKLLLKYLSLFTRTK